MAKRGSWGLFVTIRIGYRRRLAPGHPLSTQTRAPVARPPGAAQPHPNPLAGHRRSRSRIRRARSAQVSRKGRRRKRCQQSHRDKGARMVEDGRIFRKNRASSGVQMVERGQPRNSIGRASTTGASAGPLAICPRPSCFKPRSPQPEAATRKLPGSGGPIPRSSQCST